MTTVMKGKGVALMGIGKGEGEDAASKAMRAALDYKLLEENSIQGAKAALINVTGGPDMVLSEVEDAIGMIEQEADDQADIIGQRDQEECGQDTDHRYRDRFDRPRRITAREGEWSGRDSEKPSESCCRATSL